MCFACLALALASMVAVFPNAGDFNERKLTEFATILQPYLPTDRDLAEPMAARLAEATREELGRRPRPGWRAYVPVLRPNEAALKRRARITAGEVFVALRDGLVTHRDDEVARTRNAGVIIDRMARFYAALGGYTGDPANRHLLRAFSLGGLPLLSFSLLASGATLTWYPEMCGAAPSLLGGHLHHVLLYAGGAIALVPMMSPMTKTGRAWLNNLGTASVDRAAGASRAEAVFWSEIARLWSNDASMPALTDVSSPGAALRPMGESMSAACARWLTVDAAIDHPR